MPTTYSPNLRLSLLATGENSGTWGNLTNTNLGSLIEQSISGVQSISMSNADRTLTALNGDVDESRNAVIIMTSGVSLTATRSVIVPPVDKVYIVRNLTTGGQSITVRTASGSGVTIANGSTAVVYCDAANVFAASPVFNASTGSITVNVVGNVTGNLTGNVTGNASGTAANVTGTVAVANGGTGATTASAARTALGATATGDAVFTAASATAGRTALAAAATGAIGSSGVTMNTARMLGRTTAGSGAVEEISVGAGLSLTGGTLTATAGPAINGALVNMQVFTSSGTYTRSAGVTRAIIVAVGGGGGGGSIVGGGGNNGGTTSVGSICSAGGGFAGGSHTAPTGGSGGSTTTSATIAIRGAPGVGGSSQTPIGGSGGGQGGAPGPNGGAGNGGSNGGGGSGAGELSCASRSAGGGGQGATAIRYATSIGATETITIGAGGTGGVGVINGGSGGAGYVIIYEYS